MLRWLNSVIRPSLFVIFQHKFIFTILIFPCYVKVEKIYLCSLFFILATSTWIFQILENQLSIYTIGNKPIFKTSNTINADAMNTALLSVFPRKNNYKQYCVRLWNLMFWTSKYQNFNVSFCNFNHAVWLKLHEIKFRWAAETSKLTSSEDFDFVLELVS